jgi:hypothetical protein
MKKILSILVVLTVLCSTASANDVENPKGESGIGVMKSGSIFKLFYRGVKEGDVKVSIFNASGKKVFNETIRNVNNFMRPYNFSTIGEGQYTIELVTAEGKQVQHINYAVDKAIAKTLGVIPVQGSDDKFVLMISNKSTDALKIKILNNENDVVYEEQEKISGDFAKVYNVEALKGVVTFQVTDASGTTQSVKITK